MHRRPEAFGVTVSRRLRPALVLASGLAAVACIHIYHTMEVEEVARGGPDEPIAVGTPVKAHLIDGSTIVYATGVRIDRGTVYGKGARYNLRLEHVDSITALPLDSVAAMETFVDNVHGGKSAGVSTLATLGGIVVAAGVTIAIACAVDPKCFGSCPTFYSDSAGYDLLEAETFSYSIAPLFETRDLDRLRTTADGRGTVRLEGRNEALETHYLNHLELLEVVHAADELVLPDQNSLPLAVRDIQKPLAAVDRSGRDRLPEIARADGIAFSSDPQRLEAAREDDLRDYIDLSFPIPAGTDSVVVVLRLRNSLLATVLLYDLMFRDQGARSLDWIARDLANIGNAVEIGQWYVTHLGLRIAVGEDGEYRDVAWVKDSGPIAWKDAAVVIPAPPGDTLRARLHFVTDNWRIDWIGLALGYRRPSARSIPVARVNSDLPPEEALESLRAPDERYLITRSGQRFELVFETGAAPSAGAARTFLLASQGYYIEWIRRAWLETTPVRTPFEPSAASIMEAIHGYKDIRAPLEERFRATMVKVR